MRVRKSDDLCRVNSRNEQPDGDGASVFVTQSELLPLSTLLLVTFTGLLSVSLY